MAFSLKPLPETEPDHMNAIRNLVRTLAVSAAMTVLTPAGLPAQEITESHLAAGQEASRSTPAIGDFDRILPFLAEQVQNRLIRTRPDLHKEIAAAVEDAAQKLVPRRADLNNDIARIWARAFTEEELKEINTFFSSPTGEKYKQIAGKTGQEILRAGNSWMERVGEELLEKARADLNKQGFEF
jgi:hypothetical protein